MKEKFQNYSEEFLDYLLDVRGYSETSVITYEIALRQMMEVSHFYEEENLTVFDITPFRFKIVKNNKKTIVKKLSAVRSFVKYLEDQCHIDIKLIAEYVSTKEILETLADFNIDYMQGYYFSEPQENIHS